MFGQDILTKVDSDWKNYRNKKLLQNGSKVFQTNLYPLDKRNFKEWNLKLQETSNFETIEAYHNYVKATRFPKLREFWEKSKPIFTICFAGICNKNRYYWEDFQELLDIREKPERYSDCILYHKNSKVLFTPFFVNHQMSTVRIEQTVKILKDILN